MIYKQFQGTGVAIATPFRDDSSIDFLSLGKLIEHCIDGNVDYIVALGTTGEAVTLNSEERYAVINYILDTVNGRVPVVMGVSSNSTHTLYNDIKEVSGLNLPLAGLLSASPYYNKPSQEGIYLHYKKIASATTLPIIIYNVPGRTGSNIAAETTVKLATNVKNIVAIKEASGNLNQVNHILKNKPKEFAVISGDDQLALPMIAMGAKGVISVTANAFPHEYAEMISLSLNGKFNRATAIQNALLEIMDTHFVEGNPAGVKASLAIRGIIKNNLRLPLNPVTQKTYKKLELLINNLYNGKQ